MELMDFTSKHQIVIKFTGRQNVLKAKGFGQ